MICALKQLLENADAIQEKIVHVQKEGKLYRMKRAELSEYSGLKEENMCFELL